MEVRGPFVEYDCSKCGGLVSRKISKLASVNRQIDSLREEKELFCTECWISRQIEGEAK